VVHRNNKRPRRVAPVRPKMEYVDELYELIGQMAQGLDQVCGPGRDRLRQLTRDFHEVACKLETRLVKQAAVHRQATFADGELKGSTSGGAVAPPEQHLHDVAELNHQPAGQYRPAGMSDSDPSNDETWDARFPPGQPSSSDNDDDDYWFLEEWGQRH
jgi:hypothetical protein